MKIINFRFLNILVSVYRLKVVYEGKLPIFPDILHCEVMTWVSAEALSPFLMLMAALLWEATRLWFLQFFIVWTKAGVVSADAQSWGNISEPIKCCRPSMAALRMCMSPRGKAHICLYIFMCVCVLVSVWKAFISTAFDAHSLFLSFVKQGRRGNIVVLFYPKPLESTAS